LVFSAVSVTLTGSLDVNVITLLEMLYFKVDDNPALLIAVFQSKLLTQLFSSVNEAEYVTEVPLTFLVVDFELPPLKEGFCKWLSICFFI